MRADGANDAQDDPHDVAARLVDQDTEEGAQRRRYEVHHRVSRVGVLRQKSELTLEKQSAKRI